MTSNQILYGLDDRPPFGRAVVFACQHVLTMFGATVAVPLMFAPMLWPIDLAAEQVVQEAQRATQLQNTALLISSVMLCSGLATMIQVTWGTRLPIIQGISFSFLTAFAYITSEVMTPVSDGGLGGDGALAMRYIAGAIIVGAIVEMFVGFSGLIGWLRSVISPVVIGPVIMLIGLALFKHGAHQCGHRFADRWTHHLAGDPVLVGPVATLSLLSHVSDPVGDRRDGDLMLGADDCRCIPRCGNGQ